MRKIFAQWDGMNASLPADGQWLSREPPSRREIWLMPCCHRSHSSRCQKGMQHEGGIEWEEVRNISCVRKGTRRRKLIDAVEMVVCGNSPEEFGKRLPSCTGKTRQNPHNDEDRGQSQPPTPPHPIPHSKQNRTDVHCTGETGGFEPNAKNGTAPKMARHMCDFPPPPLPPLTHTVTCPHATRDQTKNIKLLPGNDPSCAPRRFW